MNYIEGGGKEADKPAELPPDASKKSKKKQRQ
jgi:hypothetical protein